MSPPATEGVPHGGMGGVRNGDIPAQPFLVRTRPVSLGSVMIFIENSLIFMNNLKRK